MLKDVGKKIIEALISVVPIAIIVLVIFGLQFTSVFPDNTLSTNVLVAFLISLVALIVGMGLFSMGSDVAMSKVGKYLGSALTRSKKMWLIVIVSALLGIMITIAEPDLTVLGELLSVKINPWLIKIVIGVGVGLFLVIGLMRIIFQKSLKLWLIFFYFIVFALAAILDDGNGDAILSITFDSGGVTTGPVTVPFLLTFGAGVASVRGGKNSSSDSFGVMGLCSVGPLIFTMILLISMNKFGGVTYSDLINTISENSNILGTLLNTALEVVIAIMPIMIFFIIYNFIFIKIHWRELISILIGFLYTFLGLTLFLTAAKIGLIPIASSLGRTLSDPAYGGGYDYLIFIIAIVIGFAVVLVEPGVHVLTQQVEEVSSGAISRRKMLTALCAGVAIAIVLACVKYLYLGANFNIIYFYVPLYIIAIGLSFTVPSIYTAVAFDSGGVASGTMSSCFVLPFIIGIASSASGRGTGFGVIGLISVMPIICVQLVGFVSNFRIQVQYARAKKRIRDANDVQVVHFN